MSSSTTPDIREADREPAKPARARAIRIAGRVAGVTLLLTGLVGVMHMPFAAKLLRKISPASLCPVIHGTPAQIDRAHALGAASVRSSATSLAPARPALGFALDEMKRTDLEAWAARYDVSCDAISGNDNLQKCLAVPAAAVGESPELGALEEITFEFKSSGELVNVQTMRRHLTPERAAQAATELEGKVAASVGEPTSVGGQPTVAHLTHGLLSTYVAVHTFADYRATVTATNLAPTGMMVREEYLSAR